MENVFRLSATLPVMEMAVAGGARPEADGRRGQAMITYSHIVQPVHTTECAEILKLLCVALLDDHLALYI